MIIVWFYFNLRKLNVVHWKNVSIRTVRFLDIVVPSIDKLNSGESLILTYAIRNDTIADITLPSALNTLNQESRKSLHIGGPCLQFLPH